MAGYVQAVAIDLDGTLALDGRLSLGAVTALDECSESGVWVILVTGRIKRELEAEFPGLTEHVDVVAYENGAVWERDGHARLAPASVDPLLVERLRHRGVDLREGERIVACHGSAAAVVAAEIAALGLDLQVIHNRAELMIIPPGISKGDVLTSILAELGVSVHNTVAIGDGENDLPMLEVAELGVAVGNAVESVRRCADVVLGAANGASVVDFLRGPAMSGTVWASPARHAVRIGETASGADVHVPGAGTNILISGEAGSGKSHLTGLLIERWLEAGYVVLVIDPEGDHAGLADLSGVRIIDAAQGGSERALFTALREHLTSVVLDLSMLCAPDAEDYIRRVAPDIVDSRAARGTPHWIVLEEAHGPLGNEGPISHSLPPFGGGYCFVTYQPERLCAEAHNLVEITITPAVAGEGLHRADKAAAVMQRSGRQAVQFNLDARRTRHVRHRHKYAQAVLSPDHRFHFRSPDGAVITTAASVEDFAAQLVAVPGDTLDHHVRGHDFSRWACQALQDHGLAAFIAAKEDALVAQRSAEQARFRAEVVEQLQCRYLAVIGSSAVFAAGASGGSG